MLGRLNHVAIAVHDLKAASKNYSYILGATVSSPHDIPEHGVTVVFVELENTKIELLQPFGENSPIQGFLDKNSKWGPRIRFR
jgi:methylmalonyl-CoA/ethylmalonyl-CoA epimerase